MSAAFPKRVSGSSGRKSPSMTGDRARLCTMGSEKDGQIWYFLFALNLLWFYQTFIDVKGRVNPKIKFCHLFTLMLFQHLLNGLIHWKYWLPHSLYLHGKEWLVMQVWNMRVSKLILIALKSILKGLNMHSEFSYQKEMYWSSHSQQELQSLHLYSSDKPPSCYQ